ncbi:MAG: hypothetical protein K5669_07550 [Lachnospiraceae bacterium]|nr:hypothetical protein [Lachnospiraceae bacterium]
MKPHFSLTQYKTFDLAAFAVILIVVEALISLASSKWFPEQLYTVSAVAGVTAIVMVRWKWFGAIHAVIGALVLCVVFKSSLQQYLIYCVGNLLGVAGIFIVKLMREERMRKNALLAILYGLGVQVLMQTGRALMALILGYGIKNSIAFFATDSLSLIFTALIVFVASRQDGMLEEQVHYIRRLQEAEAAKADTNN